MPSAWKRLQSLADNFCALTILFFVAIAVLKADALSMPPVWDEAFSVFPAAHYLAANGFSWTDLARQPGYLDGGPNVHGRSLVTAYSAAVLRLAGSPERAWPILHGVTWMWAAIGLAAVVQIARRAFHPVTALALAVFCLACPLMVAQLGQMYLEIPLFCSAACGCLSLLRGQWLLAAVWVLIATMVKGNGVVFAGAMGAAALIAPGMWRHRVLRAVALAAPSITVVLAGVRLPAPGETGQISTLGRIAKAFQDTYSTFLIEVPDLTLLWAAAIVFSVVALVSWWKRPAVEVVAALVVLAAGGFHFIVFPQVASDFVLLPRYAVAYLPFFILVIATAAQRLRVSDLRMAILLTAGVVAGLLNRHGYFYPKPRFASPALAERSEEYLDAAAVYRRGLGEGLEHVPDEGLIYCGMPEYRLLAAPYLGYTRRRFANLINAARAWPPDADLIYLVIGYPGLGGQNVRTVLDRAIADPNYVVAIVYQCEKGWFQLAVAEVRRREDNAR